MVTLDGSKVTGIICDVCRVQGDRGGSPAVMRRELAKLKWTVGERDLCPPCSAAATV